MTLVLIILVILLLVNFVLLKYSCNEPQHPTSSIKQKSVKVVQLQSSTEKTMNETDEYYMNKQRKLSNK